MLEVSDLIYETCKTYLLNQGKFILILWVCIAAVMVALLRLPRAGTAAADGRGRSLSTGARRSTARPRRCAIILLFSLVGIAGSYSVAWFGMRVNTFANSRTAMASLGGKARPVYAIPLKAGMSIGMVLISVELLHHALHPAVRPAEPGRAVLHRLRHRRIAGRGGPARGRRHLHQDRRHRRRPDEDRLQDQGGRRPQPRRHRRLRGRQRRRLGRPHRRRLRDLRRHRRRPDHLHPAGRPRPGRPGAAAGLDLRDAAAHGHHQRRCPTSSAKAISAEQVRDRPAR